MLEWNHGVVHVLGLEAAKDYEDSYLMACDGYVARPHFGVALGMYANVLVHLPSGTPIESSRDVDELKDLAHEIVRAFDPNGRPNAPTRELLLGMLTLFRFNQRRRRGRVIVRPPTLDVLMFERMMESLDLDLCGLLFTDEEAASWGCSPPAERAGADPRDVQG